MSALVERKEYLEQLKAWKDEQVIKVVTGIRRCGKSTLLNMIAGRVQPDLGTITRGETVRIGYFAQDNSDMDGEMRAIDFIKDIALSIETDEGTLTATQMMERFLFNADLQYTQIKRLSGGEKRRLYLLSVLMSAPNVLLLDEPTKGLDAYAKLQLANMLKGLCKEGAAILAVTHDVDFAAQYADECAMMFDGGIISRGEPHEFFGGNRFYTTDANRIAGDVAPGCITSGEVASQCKKLLQ